MTLFDLPGRIWQPTETVFVSQSGLRGHVAMCGGAQNGGKVLLTWWRYSRALLLLSGSSISEYYKHRGVNL